MELEEIKKLITEEHKIMFANAMLIQDKVKSHLEADKVITKICNDINYKGEEYIIVGIMTNFMLKSTKEILEML